MSASAVTALAPEVDSPGLALDVLAIAPAMLGGIALRGLPGPGREAALDRLAELMDAPVRVPVNVTDDRLLGGLDISTTLRSRRPVYERGLLELAHERLLVLSMAERLDDHFVALICQSVDAQQLIVERDGRSSTSPCKLTLVALDESMQDDEHIAPALVDRLALVLETNDLDVHALRDGVVTLQTLASTRKRYTELSLDTAQLEAINAAAMGLGIFSLRSSIHAAAAARAIAARRGARKVHDDDIGAACRLVFTHRVRQLPPLPDAPADEPPPPESEASDDDAPKDNADSGSPDLMDSVVESVTAVLPEQLLKSLADGGLNDAKSGGRGPQGAMKAQRRGRPVGVRPVTHLGTQKLNVLATVKAAAPWQRLRGADDRRLRVLPEDFRVTRYKPSAQTTSVFVVDASGSSAARRLAEVKGAVELLLAECYVTRARVAVVAFRGEHAELLLAPTRSLTRARRQLADLPGGGATPLASAIDVTRELCDQLRRQAEQAQVIFLTDGHGNVSRDGQPGHPDATEHALDAAKEFHALYVPSIVIDTSRRPRDRARRVADALGARYLPLPYADAGALAGAVNESNRVAVS